MNRPLMKELALEPCIEDLSGAAEFLDNLDFTKVKTKSNKNFPWKYPAQSNRKTQEKVKTQSKKKFPLEYQAQSNRKFSETIQNVLY